MTRVAFWPTACLVAVLGLFLAAPASAATFNLLLERNADAGAGNEVFLAEYAGFDDLVSNTIASSGFSALNINGNFSAGGLAYDGQYRLLLERNTDAGAGNEIFMATYATYDDLLSNTIAASGFSALNINGNFSAGGLAYDGQFRLLLERNTDAGAGNEVFLASFASFDDLISNTIASSGFSALNINGNFSAGGLAYDGQYRLLLERDTDAGAGNEVFLATYATYDDLLSNTIAASGFSALNINGNFSAGGLVAIRPTPPSAVPAAPALPMMATGLAMLGLLMVGRRLRLPARA